MSNIIDIAQELIGENKKPISLIYAFNGTGKTRLSVEYKNLTKKADGTHSGVYYNAFSEDLFVWDNDEENQNENMRLEIRKSNLNLYFSFLVENPNILNAKLAVYLPAYEYEFDKNEDPEIGIDAIIFSRNGEKNIKISRGEERIFVWCFFLALFEVDAWTGEQDAHFFIDDPVSSLDEHNIFITANSIMTLIGEKITTASKKRIIITTHHIGLFATLADRLTRGSKADKYKNQTITYTLERSLKDGVVSLNQQNGVFIFHLHLLKTLDEAVKSELFSYHFAILRQLLENIASFLGRGNIGYVLSQIDLDQDVNDVVEIINSLAHKNVYKTESNKLHQNEEELLKQIIEKLIIKYKFKF